ncbi:pentapeptide repeat-containing protein [Bradyrhizobium sp. CB2312]|uniref:pentapeptide repeat-containing protein n=1 Tax=Bradyrhizobium sp. CB2312 TaxID=3039155 RepID=UPI0024B18F19|nr:pentapeptide repeat-containing protein [Bradyrhizobium sp. CB2312]WFU70505.1 pentapeptide repeat-containing protein [Bradyrhizobium sp. CB2312]
MDLTTMTTTINESPPFVSLKAFEVASDALIAILPEDELSISDLDRDEIAERIERFIERATMTGTVLDTPDDRKTAQALVDFWLAKLYSFPRETRSKQGPSIRGDTLLRPFDRETVKATVANGNDLLASFRRKDAKDAGDSKSSLRRILLRVAPWLGDDGAGYESIARRMLLRTVRMPEGDGSCEPVTVKRDDLLSLGDHKRTREVLNALIASGVLREEPGGLISLRYEALTRQWDELRALITERVAFRDTAVFWAQRARADRALTSARQANKALGDYADLNELEREFIPANISYRNKKIVAGAIACGFALAVAWAGLRVGYLTWEDAEVQQAIQTIVSGGDKRSTEEAIQKLAKFGRPIGFQSLPLEDLDLREMYDRDKSPPIADFVKSAIVRVKFIDATLRYASFSQCKIYDAEFRNAELSSARFDEAVIAQSNFSGAILYRAIFDHAQFNGVNDFSNADLRSASFRNVAIIDGELKLAGTAWWLAFGWSLPQIEKFADQLKDTRIEEAKGFNDDISLRKKELKNATAPEDRVRALNKVAWTYATYGADLKVAKEEYAQKALDEVKRIKGKTEAWLADSRANFTDTIAYIWLQEGNPKEAVRLLEQPGIVDANSDSDLLFRYAFALHALALEKEGDEKERLERKAQANLEKSLRDLHYVPSHELYLLRRYITGEFKAQLANLSKEAN